MDEIFVVLKQPGGVLMAARPVLKRLFAVVPGGRIAAVQEAKHAALLAAVVAVAGIYRYVVALAGAVVPEAPAAPGSRGTFGGGSHGGRGQQANYASEKEGSPQHRKKVGERR
jgi:hypothetical protein